MLQRLGAGFGIQRRKGQDKFSLLIVLAEQVCERDIELRGELGCGLDVDPIYLSLVPIDSDAPFRLIARHQPS